VSGLEPPMGSWKEVVLEKPWSLWVRLMMAVLHVPAVVAVVDDEKCLRQSEKAASPYVVSRD